MSHKPELMKTENFFQIFRLFGISLLLITVIGLSFFLNNNAILFKSREIDIICKAKLDSLHDKIRTFRNKIIELKSICRNKQCNKLYENYLIKYKNIIKNSKSVTNFNYNFVHKLNSLNVIIPNKTNKNQNRTNITATLRSVDVTRELTANIITTRKRKMNVQTKAMVTELNQIYSNIKKQLKKIRNILNSPRNLFNILNGRFDNNIFHCYIV